MSLTRDDLWSLEEYAEKRAAFRAEVIEHKKHRQVFLGPHATLYFEDALTMKYQIQEMLRIERIFEAAGIQEELEAYNPLIPDGRNWKATFMIEYPDVEERQAALARMPGIEDKVWVRIGEEKVYAIANEDLDRTREDKTAAVHFLRFELSEGAGNALRGGAPLSMGIDHDALDYAVDIPDDVRASLIEDLD
jgi:hypothetical protein